MRYQITRVNVGVNMGDHAQDVTTAFEAVEGETVEQMCDRILSDPGHWGMEHPERDSHLIIRPVVEPGHEQCTKGWCKA